jgi:hypothetical protein
MIPIAARPLAPTPGGRLPGFSPGISTSAISLHLTAANRTAAHRIPPVKQCAAAISDTRASNFIERKDWAGVLVIFDRGLSPLQKSQHLAQNRKYCQDKLKKE